MTKLLYATIADREATQEERYRRNEEIHSRHDSYWTILSGTFEAICSLTLLLFSWAYDWAFTRNLDAKKRRGAVSSPMACPKWKPYLQCYPWCEMKGLKLVWCVLLCSIWIVGWEQLSIWEVYIKTEEWNKACPNTSAFVIPLVRKERIGLLHCAELSFSSRGYAWWSY